MVVFHWVLAQMTLSSSIKNMVKIDGDRDYDNFDVAIRLSKAFAVVVCRDDSGELLFVQSSLLHLTLWLVKFQLLCKQQIWHLKTSSSLSFLRRLNISLKQCNIHFSHSCLLSQLSKKFNLLSLPNFAGILFLFQEIKFWLTISLVELAFRNWDGPLPSLPFFLGILS